MRLATVIISNPFLLLREEARADGEGFELQSAPARVEEEHRGLLTRLAYEAHVQLDGERDARALHALGQLFELRGRENDAEVRHRHAAGNGGGCGVAAH